jgi:hypothetical protein
MGSLTPDSLTRDSTVLTIPSEHPVALAVSRRLSPIFRDSRRISLAFSIAILLIQKISFWMRRTHKEYYAHEGGNVQMFRNWRSSVFGLPFKYLVIAVQMSRFTVQVFCK